MTTNNPTTENMTTGTPAGKIGRLQPLWIGILLVVLGLAGIFAPLVSTLVVETWLALLLASAGGAKMVYAFQTRQQEGFIWKLLLSLLYIGSGVVLFIYPFSGILTLTLFLAGYLVTEGVFELILAFRLRPQKNWGWVLFNGIVTIVLGGMVWYQWPFDAPWLLGTLVGASVLFTGVSRIALSLRRISNQPDQPDQPAAA
jgi:uncharacterized membrane protein HdeD (DUF308 family)